MNHNEQRIWLIKELLQEEPQFRSYKVPEDVKDQKNLLRALMNIREPKSISKQFLDIQDEYLSEEALELGVIDAAEIKSCSLNERIVLWQGDITRLKVDAIVNAANSGMTGCYQPLHNCIDNIIHSKAGIQLRLKCNEIMEQQGHPEETGRAKITPAYNLPAKYVIHTVGPIVQGELTKHDCDMLKSCYKSILDLAVKSGVKSVAFCCISTGVFMFPNDKAAEIAVDVVRDFLRNNEDKIDMVIFNVFKDIDKKIYEDLLK